jgi:hypothetical protein
MDYDNVYDTFINKGCKLTINKEEYYNLKKIYKIPKLNYIASCGHNNSVHYNVFKSRNTGVICPKCMINNNKHSCVKKTISGECVNFYYNNLSINYILNIIKSNYTYKYTHEGCMIDLLIKPLIEVSDLWLQVKIKSTNIFHNNTYGFNNDNKNNKYKNYIIICVYVNENKIWLFDDSDITTTKISIGKYKSKYDVNEVNIENINSILLNKYQTKKLVSIEDMNTVLPKCIKIEIDHAELRKKYVKYEFDIVDKYLHTDFKLNNKNFQEKVGSRYDNKNNVNFKLTKRCSISKSYQPYNKNDNDFYWLHLPNKKQFYLIPEDVILVNEYNVIKNLCIRISKDGYPFSNHLNYYLFEYENIDYIRFNSIVGLC